MDILNAYGVSLIGETVDDLIDRQTGDSLFRIKRGLCGYVSYLAACEMNQAFSEYVLYEPILRILTASGYTVNCEHICPGIEQPVRGDKKRLDFYATKQGSSFAIEVKWPTSKQLDVTKDTEKLRAFHRASHGALAFLLVFGRQSHIQRIDLHQEGYREHGNPVRADFFKTKYSCRVFRLIGE